MVARAERYLFSNPPWRAERSIYSRKGGYEVRSLEHMEIVAHVPGAAYTRDSLWGMGYQEPRGNAMLIAAAPSMYLCLQRVLEECALDEAHRTYVREILDRALHGEVLVHKGAKPERQSKKRTRARK